MVLNKFNSKIGHLTWALQNKGATSIKKSIIKNMEAHQHKTKITTHMHILHSIKRNENQKQNQTE